MASEKFRKSAEAIDSSESLEMDMSPMIDLTFLLLIFFMVSSHLITVQIDRRVNSPIATNSQVAKEASGRVVVNILANGTVWGANEVELTSSEAISAYVEGARIENERKGPEVVTRLNLRADKDVDTRVIKKVVQAAGEAGVAEVIFGSLSVDQP